MDESIVESEDGMILNGDVVGLIEEAAFDSLSARVNGTITTIAKSKLLEIFSTNVTVPSS